MVISLAALGFLAAPGAPAADERASLALADRSPVVVAGAGFAPRERVTVRVAAAGKRLSKAVRATPAGRFRAAFVTPVDRCVALLVTATGAAGNVARLREPPPPCGIDQAP